MALARSSVVAPPHPEDRSYRQHELRYYVPVTSTDYQGVDASNHELIKADILKLNERLAHRGLGRPLLPLAFTQRWRASIIGGILSQWERT
jgi:hypothetical protein